MLRDPTLAPATRRRVQRHHNGRASSQRWKLGVQWWKTARVQTKGAGLAAWPSIRMVAISPGQHEPKEAKLGHGGWMEGWRIIRGWVTSQRLPYHTAGFCLIID